MKTRIYFFRASLFFVLFLWVLGFTSPFIFGKSNFTIVLFPLLHKLYSGVCHQLDYKSFETFGYHFHVCARCTGIYLGALIFSFLSIINLNPKNLNIKFLYIGSLPLLLDVIFQSLSITPYIKLSAFTTGLIFGFSVFAIFLSTLENYILSNKSHYSLHECK